MPKKEFLLYKLSGNINIESFIVAFLARVGFSSSLAYNYCPIRAILSCTTPKHVTKYCPSNCHVLDENIRTKEQVEHCTKHFLNTLQGKDKSPYDSLFDPEDFNYQNIIDGDKEL